MMLAKGDLKYEGYETGLLVRAYREGPERLKTCLAGLDEKELRAIVIADKWSICQIVIHLADAEIIGSVRFRQAMASHKGLFPAYDEGEWAISLKYQQQSMQALESNLRLFEFLRERNLALMEQLSEEDWSKEGDHPERGKMNIRGLLELYADHSERHLGQILERRHLLNKGIDMELILQTRLY